MGKIENALTPVSNNAPSVDNWDLAGDELSPIRGLNLKFDNGAFFVGKEKKPLDDARRFVAYDFAEGWQFLKKDCPPEYLMRKSGEAKPAQPFVAESEWPKDLNGKAEHPWKWTYFIYLMDVTTGEAGTCSSNTQGGKSGFRDLTEQIRIMRKMKPGAVPIVALESCTMPTKFGPRPRPHFKIKGWRLRGDDAPVIGDNGPKMITNGDGATASVDDEIPF
jgi:hypothetical protein